MSLSLLRRRLRCRANPVKAKLLQGFFKTGKGQYGHGDRFIGVTVPEIRTIARDFIAFPDSDIAKLLHSPIHEERLLGLVIWTYQMEEASAARQKAIAQLFIKHRAGVNNWDLVDLSCYKILGPAHGYKILPLLTKWACRGALWEKRIAMVTTAHFIRLRDPQPTLAIAKILLKDEHDLLQKASGWMLREVGKQCGQRVLEKFLKANYKRMGRTALRYAIERLPEKRRQEYLQGKI